MKYSYKAKTKDGEESRGSVDARSSTEALASLKESGLFVVDIQVEDSKKNKNFFSSKKGKVPLKERIIFTKELGMMIASGLSITEALEALAEEANNKYFSGVITSMISDIKGGNSLSSALSKYPSIFSEIYTNMVASGEESGKIELVLNRLAIQLEKDYDLNRKVKGALAYPAFVMIAIVAVMILITVIIIPRLESMFTESGVNLPMSTRIIVGFSRFLREQFIIAFVLTVGLISGFSYYIKTAGGRRKFDKSIIKIPIIGNLLRKTYIARFTRTFSALAASGLPMMEIFSVSSKTIGNIIYEEAVDVVSEKVKNGSLISDALRESPLMPRMVCQLAKVGEKSGNIEKVFDQIADFFDRDIDDITGNLSTLLEPIIMVVMGAAIGFIVISVLSPIYSLINAT